MPPPAVSLIILNYNARSMLKDCLDTLRQQTFPDFEVIVIDNGSDDDSAAYVAEHYPECTVLSCRDNLGFSKRNNEGIRAARGRYIALLNNDVTLDRDWIREMVRVMESSESIGIVGGTEYCADQRDKICFTAGRIYWWLGVCTDDGTSQNETKDVDWIRGAALFFRREVVEKIGLLDEGYYAYFEDVDYCVRAKRAGFRVVHTPQAMFWHGGSKSWSKSSRVREYEYLSKFRFIFKHLSAPQIATALFFQLVPITLYNLLVLRSENVGAKLRGLVMNIKSYSE